MNVCMFVYNACRADVRVMKEARTLAACGHDVTVVALLEDGDEPVERRDGYAIVRIERNPAHRRAARAAWRALDRVRRRGRASSTTLTGAAPGGHAGVEPGLGRFAPPWLVGLHRTLMLIDYQLRAARWASARGFEAVHAHDLLTLPAGALAARRTGARLVYDAHELYPEVSTLSRRERRAWALVERQLIRRAGAVVTVCESIAGELRRRYGVDPVVLLNVPPRQPSRERTGVLRRRAAIEDERTPLVLYTGGFAPHRGLESLIRAAAGFEDAVLVLMGWGALERRLRELVESLGLEDRVRIVAPVPPAELPALVADADIGVIPYEPVGLNNLYATPNKLFEFMAAGLPIVCTRLPELARFVDGERTGLTVEPRSPRAIADAVNRLLADDALRGAMRARGLAASRRLCWEHESAKLLALYPPTGAPRSATAPAAAGTA